MTREQAEAVAGKRERHKPRSMLHKRWQAVHTSTKGWHAALVDCPAHAAQQSRAKAMDALSRGDLGAFVEHAGNALLAQCRAQLASTPAPTADATREGEE